MWLSTSFHNLDCQRPLYSRRVVQRICPAAHTRSLCCNFGELPPKSQKHRQDAFCSLHRRANVWGAHFFFFVLLPALSHQWKGRADYTSGITLLSPRGTLRLPCAAPSLSCQQETGRWGESFLLWTSCPPMMPSSFKNKGLTKVHDYSVAHRASRPGRLTKQRDWTEGRRLTGRVNPRVNTAAQASIPQWTSCQGISSSRGSF